MLVPNLPALSQILFRVPRARAVWEANDLNLDSLAASLGVPEDAGKDTDLKSIPDAWAQFQGFADAFEFTNHPHHEQARTQWRALLAVVALAPQNSKSYELEFRQIALSGGESAAAQRFGDVLTRLPPQITFELGVGNWNQPVLILVRKHDTANRRLRTTSAQIVGMLNPATLVAVGKNATALKVEGVSWLADGLVDPTSDAVRNRADGQGLNRRDFAIIARYLDGIWKELDKYVKDNSQPSGMLNALKREITLFQDACDKHSGTSMPALKGAPIAAVKALPPPYAILANTFQIDNDQPGAAVISETLIEVRRDVDLKTGTPINGIILVDKDLPQSLNLPAHDIKIWGPYFLNEALRPAIYEIIRSEALAKGYVVARPGDFFADELVVFEDGAVVHGHAPASGFRSAVLPLSPLALLVLGPEGIGANCKLDVHANQHDVELSLVVAGAHVHKLKRIFVPQPAPGGFQVIFDEPRTMGLGLWPDFQANDWTWNFLRFGKDPKSSVLQTRFGTSGRHLAWLLDGSRPAQREQALAQLVDSVHCRFPLDAPRERLTPVDSDDPIHRLRYSAEGDKTIEELQWSKYAFEAICFSRSRAEGQLPKPAGLILLPNKRIGNTVAGCSVGLDFGTTNTIAYIQGPNDPRATLLTLKNRVVLPVTLPKNEAGDHDIEKWSFTDFMPISQNAMPIPTVAKLPSISFDGDSSLDHIKSLDDDRVLFSSLAFFLPAAQTGVARGDLRYSADATHLTELKDQLRFNLKWGSTALSRNTAKQYLRQLIIMISAELMAGSYDPRKANWRVSYPEALPDPNEFFQTIHAQLIAALGGSAPEPEEFTEAGATAAYFLAPEKDPGQVSLVLDIGGGTTDIALWTEHDLRWRSSLRLAGGDFFTKFVYNNPDFLGTGLLLRDLAAEVEKKPTPDLLELYFYDRRFDAALNDRYATIAQEQGAGLRYCALLALGGILFYVGKVVKKLIADKALNPEIFDGMTVALGGRGSQIFKRFNLATGERKSRLARVLGVLPVSAGLDVEKYLPRINMSKDPKSEVAAGMLGDSSALALAGAKPDFHYAPIGETIKVRRNGVAETLEPEGEIATLLGAEIDGRPPLAALDEFLSVLGNAAGLTFTLTDQGRRRIADETANKLRETLRQIKDAEDKRKTQRSTAKFEPVSMEPPFITALKSMVALASQPKAERDTFMEIQEGR